MEPIFPLEEEHINRFRGQLVCAVLQDGSRHVGLLGGARHGKIRLNGDWTSDGEASLSRAGSPRRRQGRRLRDRTAVHAATEPLPGAAAFPSAGAFSPFGPPVTLDLGQTAFLFTTVM